MDISLDADLQDDINVIDKLHQSTDISYGVRNDRSTDTIFMSILGVDIGCNYAEYRLMSKRVLYGLEEFKEVNLFLKSLLLF